MDQMQDFKYPIKMEMILLEACLFLGLNIFMIIFRLDGKDSTGDRLKLMPLREEYFVFAF